MSKKAINRKTIQKFTIESRENGKTDQEIYNELSQYYDNKKEIALLITGTATTEAMNQYRIYNHLLLVLLVLGALVDIWPSLSLSIQTGQLWALVFILFMPLLHILCIYEVARYNAYAYRVCCVIIIFEAMRFIKKADNSTEMAINLFLAAAIAGLAYYIDNKLFPKYHPYDLKQDSNGEYILS